MAKAPLHSSGDASGFVVVENIEGIDLWLLVAIGVAATLWGYLRGGRGR